VVGEFTGEDEVEVGGAVAEDAGAGTRADSYGCDGEVFDVGVLGDGDGEAGGVSDAAGYSFWGMC
jgi:hypothetical protein